MSAFPEPTDPRASRAEVFLGYLDFFRESAVDKVTELPPDDVLRSRLPSGWSPLELLLHLRHVERRWLEWGFLGLDVGDPWADERDGRWHVPHGARPAEVIEQLRQQGAAPGTSSSRTVSTSEGNPVPDGTELSPRRWSACCSTCCRSTRGTSDSSTSSSS